MRWQVDDLDQFSSWCSPCQDAVDSEPGPVRYRFSFEHVCTAVKTCKCERTDCKDPVVVLERTVGVR